MLRGDFKEDQGPNGTSKLQVVFGKLTSIFPKLGDIKSGSNHKMSSEIIESVLADVPIPQPLPFEYEFYAPGEEPGESTIKALSSRLEAELRQAKHTHLACGEVLLPCGLLQRISRDIIAMAESEPCGLRGCILYFNFEGNRGSKSLCIIKCDQATVSTFELYLTLKQTAESWNSFVPQFIRNLTRGGTIVISPAYVLSKHKLYRSYIE